MNTTQLRYHKIGRRVILERGAGRRIEKELTHEANPLDSNPADPSRRPPLVVSAQPYLEITYRRTDSESEQKRGSGMGQAVQRAIQGVRT